MRRPSGEARPAKLERSESEDGLEPKPNGSRRRAGRMDLLSRDKHVMPWRIEDEMKAIGANYVQAGLWRGFAVRDGNLITGSRIFPAPRPPMRSSERLGNGRLK